MNLFAHIAVDDLGPLLQLVQQSHYIRRHYELFSWLQEGIQRFLPHDIVIAAWGDFSDGRFCYDIVSPLPGVRTSELEASVVRNFVCSLSVRWHEGNHHPFVVNAKEGFAPQGIASAAAASALKKMRCALVHGIKDQRGRHNCLYIMMGEQTLGEARAKEAFRFLLPYIDTTFRQIIHLPEQYVTSGPVAIASETVADNEVAPSNTGEILGLSDREYEIMDWVRKGKTNQEIGSILNISIFTVKNHLQRIFKKLDVLNRAQAVAKLENPPEQ